jgi:hypothetical protein
MNQPREGFRDAASGVEIRKRCGLAEKRIGHLYPKVNLPKEHGGGEATVIAGLWVRTVVSPIQQPKAHMCRWPGLFAFRTSRETKPGSNLWRTRKRGLGDLTGKPFLQ